MTERIGLGIVFALLAATCLGLNVPLARVSYEAGIPSVETVLVRSVIALIAFSCLARMLRLSIAVRPETRPALALLIISSTTVAVGYISAIQFIPVGLAAIIFFTFPVIVVLVSPLVEGGRIGWARLSVCLMAFMGLTLAIGPSFHVLDWRGMALAAFGAISAAVQSFSGRRVSRDMPEIAFSVWVHMFSVPAVLLLASLMGGGSLRLLEQGAIMPGGYAVVLTVGILYVGGYFSLMRALRMAPPPAIAPFFNFEPVVSTLAAAILLGETLSGNQYAGGALVLTAIYLASRLRRPSPGVLKSEGIT